LSPQVKNLALKSLNGGRIWMWFVSLAVSAILWPNPAAGERAGHEINHLLRDVVAHMYLAEEPEG
jgi:hypothetical protein